LGLVQYNDGINGITGNTIFRYYEQGITTAQGTITVNTGSTGILLE